jgi:GNAT superfamily N-acetyltransferase
MFSRHHYLRQDVHRAAMCFCAFWKGVPVAFSAWMNAGSVRGDTCGVRREHRTVVLPDYQGIGIGNRISECLASVWRGLGFRSQSTTSHPAMIRHRSESPLWNRHRLGHAARDLRRVTVARGKSSTSGSRRRITGGFEYCGPAMDPEKARALIDSTPRRFGIDAVGVKAEQIVQQYPGATAALVGRMLGIPTSAATRSLALLVDQGSVTSTGRGRNRGYQSAIPK